MTWQTVLHIESFTDDQSTGKTTRLLVVNRDRNYVVERTNGMLKRNPVAQGVTLSVANGMSTEWRINIEPGRYLLCRVFLNEV